MSDGARSDGDEGPDCSIVVDETWLRGGAQTILALASQCDTMCLNAGLQLGDAVPGILELSGQFVSLSSMLDSEEGVQAMKGLERVAASIIEIGVALTHESEAVKSLIALNGVLSRGIDDLADEVRFLSAIVSNVKIELASIDEDDMRLTGFGETLKQLAGSSQKTLRDFQEAHDKLIVQLRRAAKAQSSFETSHRTKLVTAAEEITGSLEAVAERRKVTAGIAGEIGRITQQIGMQIAQSVVALQIGDSTRQRLEHAAEALAIAVDLIDGTDHGELLQNHVENDGARREAIIARICGLQSPQVEQATVEFSHDIETIVSLLDQITEANIALLEHGGSLVSSGAGNARSFLSDLEVKLAFARELIGGCGQSRKLVDDTAASAVSTVLELERLAVHVASMAIDMTIIGTNAVVTSHRLGKKGIALSVIAQHLRSHALRVTDAVVRVKPALANVLAAAHHFSTAREGQDAASMDLLTARMNEAMSAFQAGDQAIADVRGDLDSKVSAVAGVLGQAVSALESIDEIQAGLEQIVQTIDGCATNDLPSSDADETLSSLLRPRYTMASERSIHDDYFGAAPSAPRELAA